MTARTPGFQPQRLIQARTARDVTQTALAVAVGRSKASISKWESGQQTPDPGVITALAAALEVPDDYFFKPVFVAGPRPYFFRSMAATTKRARARLTQRLGWLENISCDLQHWLDLPPLDLPDLQVPDFRRLHDADIEDAAHRCRAHWGLGQAPVADMLLVLENAGIIAGRDRFDAPTIDGVSHWCAVDGRPYVLTASDKRTAVRSRFDAAHELGHLVLHRSVPPAALADAETFKLLERQAHRFAGAFLLPAEGFANDLRHLTLDELRTLKPRWRVAIAAMIMRCKHLGLIGDDYAGRLYKYLSARGWRRREPLDDELPPEHPRLMERSIRLLLTRGGLSADALLAELRLPLADVESLTGLPPGLLSPTNRITMLPTPSLKASSPRPTPATVVPFRRVK